MNYNKQLTDLYKLKWDKLSENIDLNRSPSNPLLLSIPDEIAYHHSDLKIIFYGKETNGWEKTFGSIGIEGLQNTYKRFVEKKGRGDSAFWQLIRKWLEKLEKEFPNKKISFLWNNTLKMGKENSIGAPHENILSATMDYFNVMMEELTILKPNVVVFLSGYPYDKHIKSFIEDVEFIRLPQWTIRELALIKSDFLPSLSMRTYHPGYLNRLQDREKQFHVDTPLEFLISHIKGWDNHE